MKVIKLLIKEDDSKKEFLISEEEPVLIGRGTNKNLGIVINHPTVSRTHARIFAQNGDFFIEDHSTHKRTFINGNEIREPIQLKTGDILKFGAIQAQVTIDTVEEPNLLVHEPTTVLPPDSDKVTQMMAMMRAEEIVEAKPSRTESPTNKFLSSTFKTVDVLPAATAPTLPTPTPTPEPVKASPGITASIDAAELAMPSDVEIPAIPADKSSTEMPAVSVDKSSAEMPLDHLFEEGEEANIQEAKVDAEDAGNLPQSDMPIYTISPAERFGREIISLISQEIMPISEEILYISLNADNALVYRAQEQELEVESTWDKTQIAILRKTEERQQYVLKKLGTIEVRLNGMPIEEAAPLLDGDLITWGRQSIYFFDGTTVNLPLQKRLHNFCKNHNLTFIPPFLEPLKKYSAQQGKVQYSYQILGQDNETFAFFSKETDRGLYLFWSQAMIQSPSYRLIPWLQGMFDAILDYLENCDQILKEMNDHLVHSCQYLPLQAMLLRIQGSEVCYSSAHSPGVILCKDAMNSEVLFTRGMALGLQKELFLEENKIECQPGQHLFFFSPSYFGNLLKSEEYEDEKNFDQQTLEKTIKRAIKKQSSVSLLETVIEELNGIGHVTEPFLLGMLQFARNSLLCQTCGKEYPLNYKFCPDDGTRLAP